MQCYSSVKLKLNVLLEVVSIKTFVMCLGVVYSQ